MKTILAIFSVASLLLSTAVIAGDKCPDGFVPVRGKTVYLQFSSGGRIPSATTNEKGEAVFSLSKEASDAYAQSGYVTVQFQATAAESNIFDQSHRVSYVRHGNSGIRITILICNVPMSSQAQNKGTFAVSGKSDA